MLREWELCLCTFILRSPSHLVAQLSLPRISSTDASQLCFCFRTSKDSINTKLFNFATTHFAVLLLLNKHRNESVNINFTFPTFHFWTVFFLFIHFTQNHFPFSHFHFPLFIPQWRVKRGAKPTWRGAKRKPQGKGHKVYAQYEDWCEHFKKCVNKSRVRVSKGNKTESSFGKKGEKRAMEAPKKWWRRFEEFKSTKFNRELNYSRE